MVAAVAFDPNNKTSTIALSNTAYTSSGLPTLVQKANTRVESGNTLTVTLASAPTAGNLLVAMITGYPGSQSGGTFPVPSGWTLVGQDTFSVGYQGGAVFTRTVVSGDAAATSFNNPSSPAQCTVFEFSSAGPPTMFSGAGSVAGATESVAVNPPTNTLEYLSMEFDGQTTYSSVTGPATLLYNNCTNTNNHSGVTFQVTGAGTVAATFGANVSYGFYIGFSIGNTPAASYTANGIATSSGSGSVAVTRNLSGPFYTEFVITTLTGTPVVGMVSPNYSMSGATLLGGEANSFGYRNGGAVYANNTQIGTIAAFVQGNRIGMAVDPVNRLVWFRVNGGTWNNDVIANQNPVGSIGGLDYSSVTFGRGFVAIGASVTGTVIQGNFSTAAFVDTPPSGYAPLVTVQTAQADAGANPRVPTVVAAGGGAAATTTLTGGGAEFNRAFMPAGPITMVSGTVQESGVAVLGRRVDVYDRNTGELLGSAFSAADGTWSLPTVGRPTVRIVGSDPTTFNSIVYDNVAGV